MPTTYYPHGVNLSQGQAEKLKKKRHMKLIQQSH